MIEDLLIALAAGAASALMFASIISGALISIAAVLSGAAAADGRRAGLGPAARRDRRLAAGTGARRCCSACPTASPSSSPSRCRPGGSAISRCWPPAGRPAARRSLAAMEWYPPGRLLLWIGDLRLAHHDRGAADARQRAPRIAAALRRGLSRMMGLRAAPRCRASSESASSRRWCAVAPAAAADGRDDDADAEVWLAGRIAATSGRLTRPWPDLNTTALPPMTLVALCVALAFCFVGGLLAIVAQIIAAALLMAYAMTGLRDAARADAGPHSRTLWLIMHLRHRPRVRLAGCWRMIVLGLADAMFDFARAQRAGRRLCPQLDLT